jgi:hypothetical protein
MICNCTVRILRVDIDMALVSCNTKYTSLAGNPIVWGGSVWMAPFLIRYKAAEWLKWKGML